MTTQAAPGWYPDPHQRFELRWFDGTQWTSNVSTNGQQGVDELVTLQGGLDNMNPTRIQQQVAGVGYSGAGIDPNAVQSGGGSIMSEPLLVVNQKAKIIEVTNQYAVFDHQGQQLGYVTEVGQSTAKKVIRVLSSLDQFLTHRLEVRDMRDGVMLTLTRPAKVMKSTIIVGDGQNNEIGKIVQANMIGKIRFDLVVGGNVYGQIRAENWRAWNFGIFDHAENEIGRITKTFEGVAKTLFTTADNYVVTISPHVDGALRALVVASALSVDTALKQDSRGLG